MALTFHCSACQTPYPQAPAPYRCLACDAPLECRYLTPTFPLDQIAARPADMWRFREALPPVGDPVSLGEARTPLIPFDLEGLTVLAKCDHTLPTGSYKDRGAALLMSYLHALGIEEAVEDSSGNAGAALAAYAARAKVRLKVFCPASASAANWCRSACTVPNYFRWKDRAPEPPRLCSSTLIAREPCTPRTCGTPSS